MYDTGKLSLYHNKVKTKKSRAFLGGTGKGRTPRKKKSQTKSPSKIISIKNGLKIGTFIPKVPIKKKGRMQRRREPLDSKEIVRAKGLRN